MRSLPFFGLVLLALLASSVNTAWASVPADPPLTCPDGQTATVISGGYLVCTHTRKLAPVGPARPPARPVGPTVRPSSKPATGGQADTCARPRSWDSDVVNGTAMPAYGPNGAPPGPRGWWIYVTCGDSNEALAAQGGSWVWTDPGEDPVRIAPEDPRVLAQEAFEQLRPAVPVVDFRPRFHAGRPESTLVGLRTFLWVDRGGLGSTSKRVTAGASWAEVTVSVQSVSFDPGDGSAPVTCPNGGTPYDPALAYDQQVADCWHVYTHLSSTSPFQLRATVTWAATWTGSGGTGGALPALTLTGNAAVPVQEVQTVNESPARR